MADFAAMEALFEDVYAAPDDDAPRAILAAALNERGDPRGELIELQLRAATSGIDREEKARIRELLATHHKAWLAPLHGALVMRTVKWERGFPVSGSLALQKTEALQEALIGRRALATLRAIESLDARNTVHRADFLERFLFESPLRGLRRLADFRHAHLPRLLDADPPFSIEKLEVALEGGGGPTGELPLRAAHARIVAGFARARGLPRLEDLTFSFSHGIAREPDSYGWLGSTDLGRRLKVLRINEGLDTIRKLHPLLTAHRSEIALSKLVLFGRHDFTLERTDDGWTRVRGRMHRDTYPKERANHERVRDALCELGLSVEIDGL